MMMLFCRQLALDWCILSVTVPKYERIFTGDLGERNQTLTWMYDEQLSLLLDKECIPKSSKSKLQEEGL